MSQPPSCFKADPQMVTVIAKLQSKAGSATSPHRPGSPLGRCRRLPSLRVQSRCQLCRQNRCSPSRSYQQIQDTCTNCSCPLLLEIFQNEKGIHLPTFPRACLFPLQYVEAKSLCRHSVCTLSLRSSQPDMTHPVPPSAIATEDTKTKIRRLSSKN